MDTEHRFGGAWTEIKLNAVADYLAFYTRALQAKPTPFDPFETWYVDAFAGTGERDVAQPVETLFGRSAGVMDRARLEGSARRAISIDPPFQHFVFIEKNARRHAALDRLRGEFPDCDIRCVRGDANDVLRSTFSTGRPNASS